MWQPLALQCMQDSCRSRPITSLLAPSLVLHRSVVAPEFGTPTS